MARQNKKISLMLLAVVFLLLLLTPKGVQAFSFDFSGTVLYDSQAAGSFCPGIGSDFEGSLALADDSLTFFNTGAETFYQDFGAVSGGYFNQGEEEFFYAFSQGDTATSQMGMIWWSDPKSFRVMDRYINNVYGLVFYLDGALLHTPTQLVAWRLADYFASGYLPTFTGGGSTLHYVGCGVASGTAFLGIIETPFVVNQSANNSAVPLPASLWFLGSGLLFVVRRRKK